MLRRLPTWALATLCFTAILVTCAAGGGEGLANIWR